MLSERELEFAYSEGSLQNKLPEWFQNFIFPVMLFSEAHSPKAPIFFKNLTPSSASSATSFNHKQKFLGRLIFKCLK